MKIIQWIEPRQNTEGLFLERCICDDGNVYSRVFMSTASFSDWALYAEPPVTETK